jgi:hypothetical protein
VPPTSHDVVPKLFAAVEEFQTYIERNAGYIPKYGERWRYGERISTAFVESAVNQVISKRMVKRQQMRWSPRGAHLLLQVRTRVLNEELRRTFGRWYVGFDTAPRSRKNPRLPELPHFLPVSGAHLLLQIRTRVLNGDWEATPREWYPGFRASPQQMAA